MAAKRAGMGRGLAAILPEADQSAAGELRELPVALVKPNPKQPRTQFDQEARGAPPAGRGSRWGLQPRHGRPRGQAPRATTRARHRPS